jgi:hypothetical protein
MTVIPAKAAANSMKDALGFGDANVEGKMIQEHTRNLIHGHVVDDGCMHVERGEKR